MIRKIRKGLVGLLLVGMPFFNITSSAQESMDIVRTITNNITTTLNWQDQYLVQATASGSGTVSGTVYNWIPEKDKATIQAYPSNHYKLGFWTGIPFGVSSTNNPCTFVVDNSYTNIVANFVPRTTNDVGFSSITVNGGKVNLQIPNTSNDSEYYVSSTTNLILNDWLSRTNRPGDGNKWVIMLDSVGKDSEFFRAKREY